MSSLSRRTFLRSAAAFGVGISGLTTWTGCGSGAAQPSTRFGPLQADPAGVLDLPRGFRYQVIGRAGDVMSDGFFAPTRPDGMATFASVNGRTRLLRNHEVGPGEGPSSGPFGADSALADGVPAGRIYDEGLVDGPLPGGVTMLDYDPVTRSVVGSRLRLAGTSRNCSGGPTPWGSWISCEETMEVAGDRGAQAHGYAFEVLAAGDDVVPAVPLVAMGRFRREAIAVDAVSGVLFQTEDRDDGCLYRFRPDVAEDLASGGVLEALSLPVADVRNWDGVALQVGDVLPATWVPVSADGTEDDLRLRAQAQGAALFARGEGIWAAPEGIYFTCTSGGPAREGQVFRLSPRDNTVTLYLESSATGLPVQPDNLIATPWGDLLICEDHRNGARIVGVTPTGSVYVFARNVGSTSELTGVCVDPGGQTVFVNMQEDGLTIAITGAFPAS